jgi:hypothetical protein
MLTVRVKPVDGWIGRVAAILATADLAFIAGMVAFIHYWARIDQYGPRGRTFIRYVLIQFHLGTENVIAAWYSSMLLLAVAAAACLVFALERRLPPSSRTDRWLRGGWLVFAALFTLLSLDEVGSLHERIGMMVALNRASLVPSAKAPVGWVYMLAVPIGAVGAFMLAFGWARLRRVPAAFALLALGVALYLADPLLEVLEGALVRSGSPRIIVERILEEGVAELGGTLCFLMGMLLYAARIGAGAPYRWTVSGRSAALLAGAAGTILTAGVPIAHWFVDHLPEGDSGIPDNWFPAAALSLLALLLAAVRGQRVGAIVCLALSAYFGAGLFVFAGWFRLFGYRGAIVDTIATAAVTIAAVWIIRPSAFGLLPWASSLRR